MKLYLHQLRSEQLLFWRSRESAIFTFIFPVLLYLLLASVYGGEYRGRPTSNYLIVGMLGYGAANTGFAGLSLQLVYRRESAILKRLRGTPLPPGTYLAATLTSILAVFTLQATALLAIGRLLFDADLPSRPGPLVFVLAVTAVTFAAIGLAAAALIRSLEGSAAVVNVILLPMGFLSGAFSPQRELPEFLRVIGNVLPLKYAIELLEGVYFGGAGALSNATALAVLGAWALGALVIAWRFFAWEPREG